MTTALAETLWDLLGIKPRVRRPQPAPARPQARAIVRERAPLSSRRAVTTTSRVSMQQKYDAIVVEMKAAYNVTVRKWRKGSSGVAWEIRYRNGATRRFIEAPYPRGPMSAAVFLHEIGHHAIGLGVYRPRCLEEYHVWMWALEKMREKGLNITPAVESRVERSMRYAVGKARRRGIREVPAELVRYT